MKVTVVTPDFSHNCLGRAWVLARILEQNYEVEIVGPMFGRSIWPPLNNLEIPHKYIRVPVSQNIFPKYLYKLVKLIDGDVVYSSKLYLSSLYPSLLAKKKYGVPLILDIDDWELGFVISGLSTKNLLFRLAYYSASSFAVGNIRSYFQKTIPEKIILDESSIVDSITVSNSFLRRKFGGTIIWHTRDERVFNPRLYDSSQIRKKLGVPGDKKVIMFFGTPKQYKGVEDLIAALSILSRRDAMLVLVGLGNDLYSTYLKEMAQKKLGQKFVPIHYVPFSKVPEIVSIADIYVIPQRESPATLGQMPAKVFDAMAMAKPIVTTYVSDLPYVVGKSGIVVEPGDPKSLADAIEFLLDNPTILNKLGRQARKRFIRKFGINAMGNLIKTKVIREIVG